MKKMAATIAQVTIRRTNDRRNPDRGGMLPNGDLQKRGDDQERQADAIERQALPLGDHHQSDEHHRDQDALDLRRERHSLFDRRRCLPVVHRYTSPRTVPKVMPTSR